MLPHSTFRSGHLELTWLSDHPSARADERERAEQGDEEPNAASLSQFFDDLAMELVAEGGNGRVITAAT